jgi:hypothetical protein
MAAGATIRPTSSLKSNREVIRANCPTGKSLLAHQHLSSTPLKYFAFSETQISLMIRAIPPRVRGAYAQSSRNVKRDAMDAGVSPDERHFLRTAKSCGSGIPTLMPSLQKRIAGDGGKKARSPGRARYKPVKPSRREGRIVSVNLWRLTRVLHYSRTRGCGCIAHPAFPAPFLRGRCLWIARAYGVARKRTCVSIVFVAGDDRQQQIGQSL